MLCFTEETGVTFPFGWENYQEIYGSGGSKFVPEKLSYENGKITITLPLTTEPLTEKTTGCEIDDATSRFIDKATFKVFSTIKKIRAMVYSGCFSFSDISDLLDTIKTDKISGDIYSFESYTMVCIFIQMEEKYFAKATNAYWGNVRIPEDAFGFVDYSQNDLSFMVEAIFKESDWGKEAISK